MASSVAMGSPGAACPWERWTGRVIPFDEQGRALLMHGHEPHRPEQPYWFSIGGALEGDEDARRAASRKLFEETGVRLSPEELHGPVLDETVEFSCAGVRVVQHQEVFSCRLTSSIAPTLDGLEAAEMATVDAAQ
ncbi:MAG: NUDIX domain-containing protein [Luteococcus sp.]|uniref:NUDIX domain-containing protein n=1 Tax=Luteococcus sp. TaxID=1969402 RepID=UPI0026482A3B|nr:NUDIX domain-containing protein [Luteococcus sp.]MDN5565063.1 NUDIX domain-containing protein [Luteococcus sp.]